MLAQTNYNPIVKILHAFIGLLFVSAAALAQSKTSNVDANFTKLLNKAGLTFKRPVGAINTPVIKNPEITYQYAVKYPKRNLEIRYSVIPYAGKPVKVAPVTNGVILGTVDTNIIKHFDAYSRQLATNAGGGMKDSNIRIGGFPPDQAKKEFGADRMTFWMIPVKNKSFATSYKFCNMVAIHKDNVGDAFIFYLCNSMEDLVKNFKELGANNVYYSLKFK